MHHINALINSPSPYWRLRYTPTAYTHPPIPKTLLIYASPSYRKVTCHFIHPNLNLVLSWKVMDGPRIPFIMSYSIHNFFKKFSTPIRSCLKPNVYINEWTTYTWRLCVSTLLFLCSWESIWEFDILTWC